MNLVAHSIASKGTSAFVRRLGTVATRFSLSPAKAERYLDAYLRVLGQFGANATFPMTAVVLNRHPTVARRLADEGVEFAVHGYIHTDHSRLSEQHQREQFARALDVFKIQRIPAIGFRSPYLRYNEGTVRAVASAGFQYISNETVSFDVLDCSDYPAGRWSEYERALTLYQAKPVAKESVRPFLRENLVNIPVAMPDDEILIDRLDITDPTRVGQIWSLMLDITHINEDILTLQLHPERGEICRSALAMVLSVAKMRTPSVWVAQLRDVAGWWRDRAKCRLIVEPVDVGSWRIVRPPEASLTVVARNVHSEGLTHWYGNEYLITGSTVVVKSARRPTIGVSAGSIDLERYLTEEGYVVERGIDPSECSVYFDRPGTLPPAESVTIAAELARSNYSLVRIGRWPDGARACLAITGDIDALTICDFVSRTWEVM
jgi:hypothetical protein